MMNTYQETDENGVVWDVTEDNGYTSRCRVTPETPDADELRRRLAALDNPRDAEDIFSAIAEKGTISLDDLPLYTRERFEQKAALRAQLAALESETQ